MNKPWYKSKTIWLNVAVILASALPAVPEYMPLIRDFLTPEAYSAALFAIGVAGIMLRAITDTAIKP